MQRTTKVQETRTTHKTEICCESWAEGFSMDDVVTDLIRKANVLCCKDIEQRKFFENEHEQSIVNDELEEVIFER